MHYAILKADGSRFDSVGQCPDEVAEAVLPGIGGYGLTEAEYELVHVDPHAWTISDGAIVQAAPIVPDLEVTRQRALVAIDNQAERARLQFLTPGSGQAMEYQATQADAARALAATGPIEAEDYPWLAAEQTALASVGVNRTIAEVAQVVLEQQAAWVTAGAAIKETRRATKMAISAAGTVEDINTILGGLTWPSVS